MPLSHVPELPRLPIFRILSESSAVRDPTLHVLRAHWMKFTMPDKTVIQSHVAPRLPEMSRMARSYGESESQSRSVVSDSLRPHGLHSPWNSPSQNTGVGSLSLLQGIFPAKGSNPGLPHCRQILYHLNHTGRPRFPFSECHPLLPNALCRAWKIS